MLLGAFQVLQFDRERVLFLFEPILRVHASLLLVQCDRDFLAGAVQVDLQLRNIVQLLFELCQLALEVLFVLGEELSLAFVVLVVLLKLLLLALNLPNQRLLLVDLALVFGAGEANLLLVDVLFEDESLTSLSL